MSDSLVKEAEEFTSFTKHKIANKDFYLVPFIKMIEGAKSGAVVEVPRITCGRNFMTVGVLIMGVDHIIKNLPEGGEKQKMIVYRKFWSSNEDMILSAHNLTIDA